ncbi:MAG: DNA polymerase III subunit gamma/tau [Patescibacteria group bacterium]
MARIALYRKHRPADFSEIEGQGHIMRVLQNAVKTSTFSHAYIFCGPRGIGKTSVARIMAKAVNCLKPKDGNPCNKCSVCVSINKQTALDIIEIDAASNRGIDEIRDLREKVKFTPSELKYKVFIIDEVHMLTKEAFNALLKTLEEPPEHALFVMATTEIHKIPATVISRCQRFDFKRISEPELVNRIGNIAKEEGIKINKEAISVIAKASEGGLRDAISFLDQISMNAGNKVITEKEVGELLGMVDTGKIEKLIKQVEEGQKKEALKFLEDLLDAGADIGQLTKGLMNGYREKIQGDLSDNGLIKKYVYAVETLSECNRNFRLSLYPQLSLEVALLKTMGVQNNSIVLSNNVILRHEGSQDSSQAQNDGGKKDENVTKVSKKVIIVDELVKDTKGTALGDDDTMEKWNQVLFEIKSKNNSIHAFVRESQASLVGDEIHLVFPYKFHKERIEDRRNRQIVEEAISKVCGHGYRVICKIGQVRNKKDLEGEEGTSKKTAKKETTIDEFLDVLGGEVVG